MKSKLIQGSKPESETLRRIQEATGVPTNQSINLMMFEVDFDGAKYYCCWAGGELRRGKTFLTLIGQAAMESLANLPMGNDDEFIVQELKLGPTPLREKVESTFKRAPPNSKICFVGDMAGELDGHLHDAFNVTDDVINIAH